MAEILVGVLGHDRPEALAKCLASLPRAGVPTRVVIHLDAPAPGVREVATASGHEVLLSKRRLGIGGSLNRILALREPGQHFCRIDGDTEMVTDRWLALMLEGFPRLAAVSTVMRSWDGTFTRGVKPGSGFTRLRMGRGIGSVMLCQSDALDRLGGFRLGSPYAFEDTDWYDRLRKLRLQAGMDLRVVAAEIGKPTRKMWRQEGLRMEPAFAEARREFFCEVRPIHRPIVSPPVPPDWAVIGAAVGTDLSATADELSEVQFAVAGVVAHSTHLEALAWAAGRAGPGAVLEVGSGWFSTPWLHGWCEAEGRWLLTIETEDEWAKHTRGLYGSSQHEVRSLPRGVARLPAENFALALVDGINEDRAAWIRAFASTQTLTVVHDTEPTRVGEFPEEAAALEAFEHRRDYTRVHPYTTVVWNGGP